MKKIIPLILFLILFLNVSPATGQSSLNDPADSTLQFEKWSKELSNFVRDVRFNELEKMRSQIGEQGNQRMKQAMAAGAAAMDGLKRFSELLPQPTEIEENLLAKYKNQLMDLE